MKKRSKGCVKKGIKRASKILDDICGAWISSQEVVVEGGEVTEFRVVMKVTFELRD